MKHTITVLFFVTTSTSFGQTLFFDNLKNSVWTSESYFNDSTIRQAREIGLTKLYGSTSLLKTNRTIWTFKTDLIISYYDCVLQADSVIAILKYEVEKEREQLRLTFDDEQALTYNVGIVSTGSYALLIHARRKRNLHVVKPK